MCVGKNTKILSVWLGIFMFVQTNSAYSIDEVNARPPIFYDEPRSQIVFSNSSGKVISCSADGYPQPTVTWMNRDGMAVRDVPGLRHVRRDGSLSFPPFSGDNYRSDVHATSYKCVASNSIGTISSREIRVKAVVPQRYDIRLPDGFVLRGNMAILECPVPSYVRDYIKVTAWERTDGFLISPETSSGKFGMLHNGDLYILDASERDNPDSFRCHTENIITKSKKTSLNYARVIVTAPHHPQPPRVIRTSANVVVHSGTKATLSCIAQSHPPPSYRWLRKKGNLLRELDFGGTIRQEGGILIFYKALPSDAGQYVCIVSNAVGEDRTEARLDIIEPLSVTVWPKEIQADAGQSVSFNCSVSGGSNEAQVSWMKDGRPMTTYSPGSRVFLYPPTSPTILKLKSVGRQDAGIYQCFADTVSDSAQASAVLMAGDLAPKFLYTFTEKIVHPGNFVSLSCQASGSPEPQIKWMVDGLWSISNRPGLTISSHVIDTGDTVSYLNLSSVDVSDGGLYSCEASNEEGSDFHSARLNVYGPVMVRRLTRNLTALSSETFGIQCPFGGYPFDEVRWLRDGNVLPLTQRQNVYTNGTLMISNVQRGQDSGPYTCEVTNRQGSHASGTFWIIVRTGPRVAPFKFDEDLHEGMRTAVPCIVPAGDKPFTIRWYKDGQLILDGYMDASIIYPEGGFVSTLTIESLARDHNGNYTCSASNEFATGSHSSILTVKVPPKWVLKPGDLSEITGNHVKMDCQADGVPQPHIRWKKATGQISEPFKTIVSSSRVHILVNGSLNFKEVSPDDAGSYLCEADNGVGAALTSVVKLIVHSAPQFRSKFSVLTARRGQRMAIDCITMRGELPITFIWSKNGVILTMEDESRYSHTMEKLDENMKSEFVINKAERQDSALFTCTATNNYGEDSTNIQLTVQDIPDAPQNLDVHDVSSRNVRLTWNRPFDGNSPITNYTVAWRQLDGRDIGGPLTIPGSETTLTVRGLIPSTRYFFRVKCRNDLGESQYSAEVAATTLQEPPRNPPLKVKASPVSSKIVNVSWEYPMSITEGSGVEGFYVGYKARNSMEPYSFIPMSVPDVSKTLHVHRLYNLNRLSEYAIVVQAYNSRGAGPPSEEIYVRTLEFDPPSVPLIKNHHATTSTITLSWEMVQLPDIPISGYILYHRWEGSSWIESYLKGMKTEHVLHDLRCGTVYLCYLVAFNGAGRSNATDIVTIKTDGNAPVAPEKRMLLTVNSSSVSIRLPSWRDGGCPISSFAMKYKKAGGRERWSIVTDDADPQQRDIVITGLEPGTWYVLFMSARNDAGSTDAEYTFATLTLAGEYPPRPSEVSEVAGFSLYYRHLTITVPLVSFSLVVSLVFCAICFVNRTRRFPGRRPRPDDGPVAPVSTKPEQLPLSVTYEGGQEGVYFPSPYATAHLQGEEQCRNQDTHRGSTKHLRSMGTFVGTDGNGCTYDTPYPIGRSEKFEPVYEPPIIYFPAYHRGLRSCTEEVIYEIPDRGRNKLNSTTWRDASDGDSSTESDNDNVFRSISHSEILKEEARESETECDRLWKAYEGSQYESSKRLADGHVILS